MMFIPSLTRESGRVLTVQDWLSMGVKRISCDLDALLIKPGVEVLKELDGLSSYWNWPEVLVLNVLNLPEHHSKKCIIRSPYDGKVLKFTYQEILELIQHLKPDRVVLPAYLKLLVKQAFPEVSEKCFELDEACFRNGDKAGQDALQGVIYTKHDTYCITDASYGLDFEILDKSCVCPACKDGFTRAYFHHMYQHTPLLCQRWLVMHNQWIMHHKVDACSLPS